MSQSIRAFLPGGAFIVTHDAVFITISGRLMMMFGVRRWNNAKGGMRFAFPPYGTTPSQSSHQRNTCSFCFEFLGFSGKFRIENDVALLIKIVLCSVAIPSTPLYIQRSVT